MRLYFADASPFARKVRVVLAETGQEGAVALAPVVVTPTTPGDTVPARNPLGKIPALEREGGSTLFDSRVICRFLDDLGDAGLYPAKPRLWDTLTLEALADGIMDAAVLMVYEGRVRPQELCYADWVEAQWQKVSRALDALEARWISHLQGPLDMGQIAVGCALGYLDFRHSDRAWRNGRPQLASWQTAFEARPAMQDTRPA